METVKVLLVEDDEDDYIITRDLLADLDQTQYELDWVNNSKDALNKLHEKDSPYDVCLLDYRLGKETGVDILRMAVSEGIDVPMVLLTQHTDRHIDLLAMSEGASDFLVKSEITSTNLDRVIRYVRSVKQHEQERLELALALEARKQADAANKSKDDFLGMVSHELRAPMSSVLMWVSLLQTKQLEPESVNKALNTIERSVKQQCKLLDDLLDLTRGINHLIRLDKKQTNIVEIIEKVIAAYEPLLTEKSLKLELKPSGKKFLVIADPDRLQQIFTNILSNSIKFTPEHGKIIITFETQGTQFEPLVAINIKDTGIGISADLLPYIFERYLQALGNRSQANSGLGLGMTIAKQLVELHDGQIKAASAGVGRGATFTVTLPLAADNHHP